MERFVVRLAAERASLSHRNQALHYRGGVLRERRETLSIDEFNRLDRRIDALILLAASEPFLAHTMRAAAHDLPAHRLTSITACLPRTFRSERHHRLPFFAHPQCGRQPPRRPARSKPATA